MQDEQNQPAPKRFTAMLSSKARSKLAAHDDAALWTSHSAQPLTEEQFTRLTELGDKLHALQLAYHTPIYNGEIKSENEQRALAVALKSQAHALLTEEYADLRPLTVDAPYNASRNFLSPDGKAAITVVLNHNHYADSKTKGIASNDLFPELIVKTVAKRRDASLDSPTIREPSNIGTRNMFYTKKDHTVLLRKYHLSDKAQLHESSLDIDASYTGNTLLEEVQKEAVNLYRARRGNSPEEDLALRLTFNAVKYGLAEFQHNEFFSATYDHRNPLPDHNARYQMTGRDIAQQVFAIYQAAQTDVKETLGKLDSASLSPEQKATFREQLLTKGDTLYSWQDAHDLAVVPEATIAATGMAFSALHASGSRGTEADIKAQETFEKHLHQRLETNVRSLVEKPKFLDALGIETSTHSHVR